MQTCSRADPRSPAAPGFLRGFTLIEVMIVVAIVAILATIALPAYADYVRRGRLPEAFTLLADYRVKMEQYYQDNRGYGKAGCADEGGPPSWADFVPPGAKHFAFSCQLGADNQTYTLTASGIGGAGGHVYTLTHAGVKATTMLKGKVVAKTCWAAKESDC